MAERTIKLGTTSNILRFKLRRSDTGQGLTALTYATAGLIISTICDNEAAATVYTQAAGKIEDVSVTLGAFVAPTATKCRLRKVDDANLPGTVELQLDDARFAVVGSKVLRIAVLGAANLLETEFLIELVGYDPIATDISQSGDSYAVVAHGTYGLSAFYTSILSKLLKYVQLLTRKDAAIATDNATELTAINASGGSGVGAFSNQTDSEEAIRDTEPLGTAMRGTDSAMLATAKPTVGGYDTGQDPATLLLVTPANKISTDSANAVKIQKMAITLASGDVSGNVAADVKAWNAGALPTIPAAGPDAPTIAVAVRDVDNTTPAAGSLGLAVLAGISAAPPSAADIADKVLGRNIEGGVDGGRTVGSALAPLRNKVVLDPIAKTITVYDKTDAVVLWSGVYVTTAGAEPMTTVDPA
jgi:hypothetical protein